MKCRLTLFIFCFAFFHLSAQSVFINGYAPGYKNQEMTLFTYGDFVSNVEIPVATQQVNDSGFFKFRFDTKEIKYILLRAGKQKANMYLEPGREYKIYFPLPDSGRVVNPNVEQKVDLTFAVTDSTELNALIIDYNEQFGKFWTDNYQYFVQKKSRARLDSFELNMLARYAALNNPYFKSYIIYNIAELDLNTFQGKNDLARKYISGKPVLYDSHEYMNFFNKYFNKYLQFFCLGKNGSTLTEAINTKASYESCLEALSIDKLLKSDTLRELVLINGLSQLYYLREFKRANIIRILERISSTSKIEKHQAIAGNVLRSFSKLQPGAPAPAFSLKDKTGKQINLSDFDGKYVYLDFWATWCSPCLQELKLMVELQKKYGDKIVFISITTDEDSTLLKKFLLKNPKYDWLFLQGDAHVKADYEIQSIPSYFLINTFGKLEQSPALRPSEMIEATFSELTRKKTVFKTPGQ